MTDYIHPCVSDSRFHAEGYERLRTSATGRTQVPLAKRARGSGQPRRCRLDVQLRRTVH